MKNILLVLAFLFSFLLTSELFLKEPPIWPDEASLFFASSLFNGNLIDSFHTYPSVYPALLSNWLKIFGASIESQRLLSVVAGFIIIIIFCLLLHKISKTFFKNSIFQIVPIILLITDFTFLQGTRVGRPEIFTLLFGLISTYLTYLFISKGFKNLMLLGTGLVSAIIAFSFHANGIIYLPLILIISSISYKKLSNSDKKIIAIFSSCLTLISVFILSKIMPPFSAILNRLQISNAQDGWLIQVFTAKSIEIKIIYLSLILITFLFIFLTYQKKRLELLTVTIPLVLAWLVLIFNKDFWYALYLVPFSFLASYILLENYYLQWQINRSSENKFKFFSLVLLCLTIFFSNFKFQVDILVREGGEKLSYAQYAKEIKQIIPDKVTVFTSAIPDPYYIFLDRNNKLIRFPQSFVSREYYLELLDESDYMIFTASYTSHFSGDLVWDYLKLNYQKLYQIGEEGQYQGVVVEFKPRNQRKYP